MPCIGGCAMHIRLHLGVSEACSYYEMSVADTLPPRAYWLPRHQVGFLCDAELAAPRLSRAFCHRIKVSASFERQRRIPLKQPLEQEVAAVQCAPGRSRPCGRQKGHTKLKTHQLRLPGGAVHFRSGHTLASAGLAAAMRWV